MEAMDCGKPVIGANAGGVPEEVEDGVTGLLYHPGDAADMADKICQLLSHPDVARNMGAAGRERVKTLFDKTTQLHKIEAVYQSLARRNQWRPGGEAFPS